MKTIKIKRSKWLRANGTVTPKHTVLLNKEGSMCCLGFTIHQVIKCKKEKLLNIGTPRCFFKASSFLTKVTDNALTPDSLDNNDFAMEAIMINDCPSTTDKAKEKKLTVLFKKNGYNLVFED
jgi:hypothetical protein